MDFANRCSSFLYVMSVLKVRWRFLVFLGTLLTQVLDFLKFYLHLLFGSEGTECSSMIACEVACLK